MEWRYQLPRDVLQRRLRDRVLRAAGAPFDPADKERFSDGVRRVWHDYQEQRRRSWPLFFDRLLHTRNRDEHIDDPTLPEEERRRLIHGLDRLNRVVGAYQWLFWALRGFLDRTSPGGEVSVLDLGSGHGAFPIKLAQRRTLGRHHLRVVGSDLAPDYVAEARRAAAGVDVEFRVVDALALDQLDERFDLLTCSQTVHHFPPELLARMLASARAHARRGVLFFDAQRSALNLVGSAALGFAMSGANPRFVHDAVVSVRRMYGPGELELLARCAPGGEAFRAANYGPVYVVLEASA